jgi:hypothetical protein
MNQLLAVSTATRTLPPQSASPPQFETLMFVGAVAVVVMIFAWTHERASPAMALVRAGACIVAAAYGFLQGAWPLGIAALAWAVAAFWKWWTARQRHRTSAGRRHAAIDEREREMLLESRLSRLFGPP